MVGRVCGMIVRMNELCRSLRGSWFARRVTRRGRCRLVMLMVMDLVVAVVQSSGIQPTAEQAAEG